MKRSQTGRLWRLALLALAALTWTAIEWRARATLRATLGDGLYRRLEGQFTGAQQRYRLVAGACLVLAFLLAELIPIG